jgi:PilZ domain-containing protein
VQPIEQSQHIDEKDLEQYLKAQLNHLAVSAIDAHLAGCRQCVDKLAEQDRCLAYLAELGSEESPAGADKRAYPRVATDEPATLQMLNPFSAGKWDARIVDVSPGGLRTHTPKPLTPGALMKIHMQFSISCGDVRYCIPADKGFYAGIRVHDYFFR